MSLNVLECQASKMVNIDTCTRPTTHLEVTRGGVEEQPAQREVRPPDHPGGAHLGFGRIVGSETGPPNLSADVLL
jgi:hypothetical protein